MIIKKMEADLIAKHNLSKNATKSVSKDVK